MYFTRDIIDANGVQKKQFYKSIGAEDFETGNIVQIRQFVGEYSKQDLENMRVFAVNSGVVSEQEIIDRKTQSDLQVAEIDDKLSLFV